MVKLENRKNTRLESGQAEAEGRGDFSRKLPIAESSHFAGERFASRHASAGYEGIIARIWGPDEPLPYVALSQESLSCYGMVIWERTG